MLNALIVGTIEFIAGIVQNITGFGASVVSLLVLPRLFGLIEAATLNQSVCVFTTCEMAYRYRKYVNIKSVLLPTIAYTISSLTCVWIVKDIDLRVLSIAFGAFLVVLAFYCTFIQKNIKINPTPAAAIICGFIGGICSGLFTNGATAMAVYFISSTEDRNHYLGNFQFLLGVTNILNIALRIYKGHYSVNMIPMTIIGTITIFLGHFVGRKIGNKLKPETLKSFVYLLVAICGIETLIKNL